MTPGGTYTLMITGTSGSTDSLYVGHAGGEDCRFPDHVGNQNRSDIRKKSILENALKIPALANITDETNLTVLTLSLRAASVEAHRNRRKP
jgi:hypothetical protein